MTFCADIFSKVKLFPYATINMQAKSEAELTSLQSRAPRLFRP